ncbi:hypothetical protein ACLKA6_008493 [Drosophila palustris]
MSLAYLEKAAFAHHYRRSTNAISSTLVAPQVESREIGIRQFEFIPKKFSAVFKVACDAETQGGGWTIILKRTDGSEIFYRGWNAYKRGFGSLDGEFFLGLDKIHALTADCSQELLVILEDFEGDIRYEHYERFGISDEQEQYALNTLGKASGTAGDSLSYHHGMKFTTHDRDNDRNDIENCAITKTGAWWYDDNHRSNLAGRYNDTSYDKGVIWGHFRGYEYSLKRAVMMIHPKK